MVESTGMKCIKYLMIIFNVLFLLGGIALIIVGAIVQAQSSKLNHVNSGAVLVLVIGGVIFLLAFLGCCGANKENRCMLITFAVLMIIIFVISLAAIIIAFVFKSQVEQLYLDPMWAKLKAFDPKDQSTTQTWNQLQYDFRCCGINNYTDWTTNNTHLLKGMLPASCCGTDDQKGTCATSDPNLQKDGCISGSWLAAVEKSIVVVGVIIAIIAFLELLGIIFAFALAHAIHKGYNVV